MTTVSEDGKWTWDGTEWAPIPLESNSSLEISSNTPKN